METSSIGYKGWMLHRLVRVWSGKELYIEDGSPRTDGRRMYLPISDPAYTWENLMGFGEHESAHIRFSNFKQYERAMKKLAEIHGIPVELAKRIINMFEDYRIENLMPRLFAGSKLHFEDLYKLFKERRTEPVNPLQARFYKAIDTLFGGTEDDPVALKGKELIDKYMTFGAVVKASSWFIRSLSEEELSCFVPEPELTPLSEGCKSKLVSKSEVDKVLKTEAKEEGKAEEGEEGAEEREEELGLSPDEKKALEKAKKKIDKEIEKERRKIMDEEAIKESEEKGIKSLESKTRRLSPAPHIILKHKLVKDVDELARVNETSLSDARMLYRDIINKNAGLIQALTAQLSQIRASKMKVYAKSGRLKISRAIYQLASQKKGSATMFVREVPTYGIDVLLLVDQSGSMSWFEKIDKAREAVIVFAEAMKRIPNVNFAVFGFGSLDRKISRGEKILQTNYTLQYKDFEEPNTEKIALMRTLNGNRDGFHFRVAADILKRKGRLGNKKILVILSDGEPLDNPTSYAGEIAFEDTKKALNEIRQQGIKVFALGFGVKLGWTRLYGDCGTVVEEDLKGAMMRLVALIQQMVFTA